jgi:hypothetical protein
LVWALCLCGNSFTLYILFFRFTAAFVYYRLAFLAAIIVVKTLDLGFSSSALEIGVLQEQEQELFFSEELQGYLLLIGFYNYLQFFFAALDYKGVIFSLIPLANSFLLAVDLFYFTAPVSNALYMQPSGQASQLVKLIQGQPQLLPRPSNLSIPVPQSPEQWISPRRSRLALVL